MSALQNEVLFDANYKRTRSNFTIREDIKTKFKDYIEQQPNGSMSRKIEGLMESFLIEVGVIAPKKT